MWMVLRKRRQLDGRGPNLGRQMLRVHILRRCPLHWCGRGDHRHMDGGPLWAKGSREEMLRQLTWNSLGNDRGEQDGRLRSGRWYEVNVPRPCRIQRPAMLGNGVSLRLWRRLQERRHGSHAWHLSDALEVGCLEVGWP